MTDKFESSRKAIDKINQIIDGMNADEVKLLFKVLDVTDRECQRYYSKTRFREDKFMQVYNVYRSLNITKWHIRNEIRNRILDELYERNR